MVNSRWRGVLFLLALGLTQGAGAQQSSVLPSATAVAEQAFTRGASRPAWVDELPVSRADKAHGPYSVALSDIQIHLDAVQAVYVRRAIEVHHATALEDAARIDLDFLPAFQTFELHGVNIIRAGQRLARLDKAQVRLLQREGALDQGVYRGAVTVNIIVDDLRVGDILDVDYTVRGANPVFGGKLVYSATWDSQVATGRRRVVLDAPDARAVRVGVVGGAGAAPVSRTERRAGRVRTIYDAAQLPALLPENHVPSDAHAYRWLQFSEMASWEEVGRWADGLFSNNAAAASGPQFEALLKELRAAGTPEQQAVKALEFVQGDVRYLSVAIGENSHRPALPETVLERRYGDCKDKSQLLVTLLNRLGIEAHVALLASGLPSGLDSLLPSPLLFDHAIVHLRLDGRAYLLDPTRAGQHGSLARMGQPYAGYQLLLARPGTRALTVVPMTVEALSVSRRIERFELDKPGAPAELTVTREANAATAEAMRGYLAAASIEQHTRQLAAGMTARFPDAVPLGDVVIEDDRAANLVRLTSRYRIPTPFVRDGANWRMSYAAANLQNHFNKSDNPARRHAMGVSALQPGERLEYELEVRFREPVIRRPHNGKVNIDDPAFVFEGQGELSARRIHLRMAMRGGVNRLEPQQIAAYTRNLARLEEELTGAYLIDASPLATATADPLRERLAQLTAAVANAGFRGVDPAAALCERARVHLALNQVDDAFKDAQQATRLQPKSHEALLCRAEVHFAARRFKEAEADYARAAALGADRADLYAARALNAFYLAQPALASGQFRSMLAKADTHADRLHAHIWLALMKSSAGPTGGTPAIAASERWLTLILDAVQGRDAKPETIVAAATGDGGPGANARLGETYFYLGKLLQSKGERWKAIAYFKQAAAKLAAEHPYRHAVGHELLRMEEKTP